MVAVFKGNPPLQANLLAKEFFGLWIEVSGIIRFIDDMGGNYVTINFNNFKDEVFISANFDKPYKKELTVLDKGEKIKLLGEVSAVDENIVVLDHCELIFDSHKSSNVKMQPITINNFTNSQIHSGRGDNIGQDKILKDHQNWLTSYWVQVIAGLTLAGLLAVVGWYWNTIRQDNFKTELSDKNRTAEEAKIIDSSVFRLATKTDYSEPLLKTQQRWQAYSGFKTKDEQAIVKDYGDAGSGKTWVNLQSADQNENGYGVITCIFNSEWRQKIVDTSEGNIIFSGIIRGDLTQWGIPVLNDCILK